MAADRRAVGIAVLVAVVATGVAVAAWRAERSDRERDAARIVALEREVATLRERVGEEASERAVLALEATQLRGALEQAMASAAAGDSQEPAPPPNPAPPERAATNAEAARAAEAPSFDPEPRLAAGFRPDDVERVRARLGESLYDWALFSTGHANCVAVTEVLSGSSAQSAGLQPSDVFVRYDERLVLTPTELRDATTRGREGELVSVEVPHAEDPAPLRLFVPRGSLGVRMTPTSVVLPPAG